MPGDDHTNGFFVSCFVKKAIEQRASTHEVTVLTSKRCAEETSRNLGAEVDEEESPHKRKKKKKAKKL